MKRPEPVLTRGLAAPRHHNIRNPCLPRAVNYPLDTTHRSTRSEQCYDAETTVIS